MLQRDVAKGIHRIEDAYTNWYLVEEAGDLTIVDCGVRKSWTSLRSALDALGAELSDIKGAVLTHGHFDHIGFAERLRVDAGVEVWIHENDVPLTRHPSQYAHAKSRIPYLLKRKSFPIQAALLIDRAFWPDPLGDVRRIEAGSVPLPGSPKVVFTPGHTAGHCAFHFPDRDVVIAGDALVMLDPYSGREGPRLVAGAATADVDRNLATLDAIAETGAAVVLTGHGEPWTGGAKEAVHAARAATHADLS